MRSSGCSTRRSQAKSQTVRLADRAARLYAPVVHATAALTAIGWLVAGASLHDSIVIAIAVLIITCPCAIALAIPAVQVVAAGSLFRSGVILNGGDAIERLAEADTIVFDKTGTLTLPDPRVDETADIDPDVLERAARLALSSRHPLAAALARAARDAQSLSGRRRGAGARRSRDHRRHGSAPWQRRFLQRRRGSSDCARATTLHHSSPSRMAKTLQPSPSARPCGRTPSR